MNIIDQLISRIESARAKNKNVCRNYLTKEKAEAATLKMAKDAADHFSLECGEPPAHYLVFYVPSWNRWVGAIDLSELLRRKSATGGYLGFCEGFFTY